MKHFISVNDVENLNEIVDKAIAMKRNPLAWKALGVGKTLGLVFFNASLRTRMSTQKAAFNLGMDVIILNVDDDSWKLEFGTNAIMDGDTVEHASDAIGVIGEYCDIIGVRTFAKLENRQTDYSEQVISSFLQFAKVPIISLESATLHPLQSLADMITIKENQKNLCPKIVLSWAPHPKALPQAVANSFLQWTALIQADVVVTHPKGYELSSEYTKHATVEYDQDKALEGADFVYVKNWSSYTNYGQVLDYDKRRTMALAKMALTNNGQFMHCSPIRRNVVATDEVVMGENSLVLKQAGNRVWAAQVVLKELLETEAAELEQEKEFLEGLAIA